MSEPKVTTSDEQSTASDEQPKGALQRVRNVVGGHSGRVAGTVKGGAGRVADTVKGGVKSVQQTVSWANQGIDEVRERIDAITDAGKAFLDDLRQSVDLRYQLKGLSEGDVYTLHLGASGAAEGIKLFGQGQIDVRREADGFWISADGDAGGGLFRELGGRLASWKLGASIEVLLGAGVGVEMFFETLHETQRTIELLLRLSTLSAVGRVMESLPLVDKVVPEHILRLFVLSEDEKKYLIERADAYTVRGQLAPELALALGVSSHFSSLAGVFGQGYNKEQVEARIELDAENKPKALTLRMSGSLQLSWGAGTSQSNSVIQLGLDEPRHAGSITLAQRFIIPPEWSVLREEEGFISATRKLAKEIIRTKSDTLSLVYKSSVDDPHATKLVTTLEFTGDWGELLQKDVLRLGVRGALEDMLATAGENLRLHASMLPYSSTGLQLTPALGVMGVGASLNVHAGRETLLEEPRWELEGNAALLAKEVGQRVRSGVQWLSKRVPRKNVSVTGPPETDG